MRAYGDPIMRSTVGPLPPAVYWRRRALVGGVLLLIVIALFVSCGGGDDADPRGSGNGASQAPTPTPDPSASVDPEPSFADAQPGGSGPSLPAPEDLQSPGGGNPSGGTNGGTNGQPDGSDANVNAPNGAACADQEVTVTPVPGTESAKRGTPVVIKLKIKNVSNRTCTRDLGAGAQELYIDQGARKYWSSDTCSSDRSANQQQLRAGAEFEYAVTWNGRQSSKCTAELSDGPAPPPGTYEVRGRLGTKISEPVALAIAG